MGFNRAAWNRGYHPDPTKKTWEEMTDEEKTALKVLGYSGSSWDNREPFSNYKFWVDLTEEEKQAALALGYKTMKWNNRAGQARPPDYVGKSWAEMTQEDQAALEVLGFNEVLWDGGTSPLPLSAFKTWKKLSVCGSCHKNYLFI